MFNIIKDNFNRTLGTILGMSLGIVVTVLLFRAIPITYTFQVEELGRASMLSQLEGTNPDTYDNLVWILEYIADSNDTVHIKVYSPGGDASTAQRIIIAMESSAAHVITEVKGFAASGGALILISGDEIICDNNSPIMFHRPYQMVKENGKYVKKFPPMDLPFLSIINDVVKDKVFKVMTSDEKIQYILGKDIWFTGDKFKKRLKNL